IKELEETILKQFEQIQAKDIEVAELKRQLSEKGNQVKELETERDGIREKHKQLRTNVSEIFFPEIEGSILAENDEELIKQAEMIIKKLKSVISDKDILERENEEQKQTLFSFDRGNRSCTVKFSEYLLEDL